MTPRSSTFQAETWQETRTRISKAQLPDVSLTLFPSHAGCTSCELHTLDIKHVGVPSEHLPTSLPPSPEVVPVLVVGQNPGYNEDVANRPFVGKSGDMVRGRGTVPSLFLPSSVLARTSVYLSNLVRCFHQSTEPLKARWISPCRPYLLHDLRRIAYIHDRRPIIYTLGGPAATHIYKLGGRKDVNLNAAVNSQFTDLVIDGIKVTVFSTYHPAYLLRQHNIVHAIQGHLDLLVSYIEDRMPQPSKPSIVPTSRPPRNTTGTINAPPPPRRNHDRQTQPPPRSHRLRDLPA